LLPANLLSPRILAPRLANGHASAGRMLKTRVEALEREMIEDALRRFDGNISRASEELGLSRVGMRNKIERYGVERDLRDDDE
jgi:two-component system response regulator HupR/HoxA